MICLLAFFGRNRIRQYPAFVNCTTIDWFSEWPNDALLEVAEKYLEDASLGKTAADEGEVSPVMRCHGNLFVSKRVWSQMDAN